MKVWLLVNQAGVINVYTSEKSAQEDQLIINRSETNPSALAIIEEHRVV